MQFEWFTAPRILRDSRSGFERRQSDDNLEDSCEAHRENDAQCIADGSQKSNFFDERANLWCCQCRVADAGELIPTRALI